MRVFLKSLESNGGKEIGIWLLDHLIVLEFLLLPNVVLEHRKIEWMCLSRSFGVVLGEGEYLNSGVNRDVIWAGIDDE